MQIFDPATILQYVNESASRNLPVSPDLEREIREGVLAVYGPDYRVEIMSGAQGPKSNGIVGSRRHTTGVAADVFIFGPDGDRLTGDALIPIGQHWRASNIGGVGFPAKAGQSLHLDLVGGQGPGSVPLGPGEGMVWYYGNPTTEQRKALTSGEPPKYAHSMEQVRAGAFPPGEVGGVGTQLDTARSAPLFRFDSMGNPINATTGERVLGTDPAYGHLMAFRQASVNSPARPPNQPGVTPRPLAARPGVIENALPRNPDRQLPVIGPTGGPLLDGSTRVAPTPAAMPQSVQNTRGQNDSLTARLARADAEEIADPTQGMNDTGSMPSFAALGGLRAPTQALGGNGVTRTAGIAGTVAMPPGVRPNVPSTTLPGVDDIGAMPTQTQFRSLMRPVQVENPAYTQALNSRARVPLGEVIHTGSRDTVAQRSAGQAMAQRMPPRWITRMQTVQVPVQQAPARQPLRVVVNGGMQQPNTGQAGGGNSPGSMSLPGYTNDGNGKLTSTETGGVYYERHLN